MAVIGTGNLGLSAVQVIKAMGATIHSVGIEEPGLESARHLGTDEVMRPEQAARDSYSVVLEFSGSEQAAKLAPEVVAPGGRIGYVGIVPVAVKDYPVSSLVIKDVEADGILSGLNYWDRTLGLAAKRWLNPRQLVDRVFPYTEAPAAFERLISPNRARPKLAISFEGGSASLSYN